jgi:2-keto-4-pentenoate hydratase/2-oxohepta-3-ene-1,7-dioic acid hydratase in catechol pathway
MNGWSLGTFAADGASDGEEFAGIVAGDRVRRLESGMSVTSLLADWEASHPVLDGLAASDRGEWLRLRDLRVLPPHRPRQILQAGANYRTHVIDLVAAEFMADNDHSHGKTLEDARRYAAEMMDKRASEGEPYLFIGLPTAICGAYDDIVLPPQGHKHDYELELAVVIGQRARNVGRDDALSYVAGYTICNDLTTRDRLYRPDLKAIGTDWLRAKNAPTFLPTGPWITPADQVGDVNDLRITLRHNGVLRQDEAVSDMIFGIPVLIEYASRLAELLPGDLLLTGSPAGNGAHWGVFLRPGDIVEAEITGLGTQRNRVT